MVIMCVTHTQADGSRKVKYSPNESELSDFLLKSRIRWLHHVGVVRKNNDGNVGLWFGGNPRTSQLHTC